MKNLIRSNSKRLKILLVFISLDMIIGLITLFFRPEYLKDIALYITTTILPLMTYIIGETIRPSNNLLNKNNK